MHVCVCVCCRLREKKERKKSLTPKCCLSVAFPIRVQVFIYMEVKFPHTLNFALYWEWGGGGGGVGIPRPLSCFAVFHSLKLARAVLPILVGCYDYYYYYWSLLYSTILCSWADSLRSHVILHEWIAFYSAFWNIHGSDVYLQCWHGWCHMKLLRVLCTPYNYAPCHFMQSQLRKVYACLAVTCHPRFWQKDRGLLCATVVTRGWNRYRNKSQHRKLTLEKEFCCSCRELNPQPFNHESGTLTTEVSPLPDGG